MTVVTRMRWWVGGADETGYLRCSWRYRVGSTDGAPPDGRPTGDRAG